jgi:hypothetical protein
LGAFSFSAVSAWAKSIFAAEFFGGVGVTFTELGFVLVSALVFWPEVFD